MQNKNRLLVTEECKKSAAKPSIRERGKFEVEHPPGAAIREIYYYPMGPSESPAKNHATEKT